MDKLFDVFETTIEFKEINDYRESLKEADGSQGDLNEIPNGVLGVFEVNHAFGYGVPYGISRNGRLYTKKVWETALNDSLFKEVFENGLLVGTIGHPDNPKLNNYDEMIKEDLASHVIKEITFIDKEKDKGIGKIKAFILDTKAGRALKSLLATGANLSVSTRAYGALKEEKVEVNGKKLPVIDANNFKLITIDIVTTPGIKNAKISNYKLKEDVKKDIEEFLELSKKHNCINGICELVEENESTLEALSKKEIIDITKNLIEENKKLNSFLKSTAQDEENKDIDNTSKLKTIFISNLETLIKILKFTKEYEKEVKQLIEIIDKNNILDENEIKRVKEILQSIKFNDESFELFKTKFLINIEDLLKNKNNTQQENIAYYLFLHWRDKFYEVKKQLDSFKDITERIIELKEEINFKNKQLDIFKNKNEKLVIALKTTINNFKEDAKEKIKLENKLKQIKEEMNVYKSKYEKLQNENVNLIETIRKIMEENESLNEENRKIKEQLNIFIEEIKEVKNENLKTKEEIKTLKENLYENEEKLKQKFLKEAETYKVKYLALKYKVTEDLVRKHLNNPEKLKEYRNVNFGFNITEAKEVNEIETFINKIL